MSRRFSTKQRIALVLNSQGKCSICGAALLPCWHADHQQPWSKGGMTDATNGQALCASCNLKKSNKIMHPQFATEKHEKWLRLTNRDWQKRALKHYEQACEAGKQDFLLVAAPATGKTLFALTTAYKLIRSGHIDRVVVVCPSDHLRGQWARVAAYVGLWMDARWSNADGIEAPGTSGAVVTYQQVAFAPSLHRMLCRRRTLVIFDEIHHVGDQKAWGGAMKEAFEQASFRLALSGTPFRNDHCAIPFIRYEQGCSIADFTYGYAEAVADGVCRPVFFPSFDANVAWLDRSEERRECSLLDVVDRQTASERLRATLDLNGEWMRHVITEANRQILEARANGHLDAAGLIVAINQDHAKQLTTLTRDSIGEEPTLAISENADASERIKDFASGMNPWLITVRMVSEGVDIPRLRVGIYATTVTSELFFRQVIGRITRWVDGLSEQSACLFIPADEILMSHALGIREERQHRLAPAEKESGQDIRDMGAGFDPTEWGDHLITVLSADPKAHDVIFSGNSFPQPELTFAAEACSEHGIRLPFCQVATLIRLGAAQAGVFINHRVSRLDEEPTRDSNIAEQIGIVGSSNSNPSSSYKPKISRSELRRRIRGCAETLAEELNIEINTLHEEWESLGGMPFDAATTEDLERKLAWLKHRFSDYLDDRYAKGREVTSRLLYK